MLTLPLAFRGLLSPDSLSLANPNFHQVLPRTLDPSNARQLSLLPPWSTSTLRTLAPASLVGQPVVACSALLLPRLFIYSTDLSTFREEPSLGPPCSTLFLPLAILTRFVYRTSIHLASARCPACARGLRERIEATLPSARERQSFTRGSQCRRDWGRISMFSVVYVIHHCFALCRKVSDREIASETRGLGRIFQPLWPP